MIRHLLFIGLVLVGTATQAQQVYQYTQYLQNPIVFNPAAAGIHDYTDINFAMRRQWEGFDNAPQTYYLSANHRFGGSQQLKYNPSLRISSQPAPSRGASSKDFRHGVGGFVGLDSYGAFQRLLVNGAYAFHIPLGNEYFLSAGAGLGISRLQFDQSQIVQRDPNDNTYNNFISNGESGMFMDLHGGLWFYGKGLNVGYSVFQALGDRVSFTEGLGNSDLRLHHLFTAGYDIKLSDLFDITPSAMLKLFPPAPVSFDLSVIGKFRKMFWLGAMYRHTDAIGVIAGYAYRETVRISYSYDIGISGLRQYNSGGHEIVLGLMLGR